MREIPDFLVRKVNEQYSKEDAEKILKGLIANRKTTFRVNILKTNKEKIIQVLDEKKIKYSLVSWNENAFILENASEKEIRELSIYKNGEIYLQSLSSMIPAFVLEPKEKENLLDMTAAPRRKNFTNCCYV